MTFPLAPLRLSFDRRAVQQILLAGASLGESSMVEQRTLTPLIFGSKSRSPSHAVSQFRVHRGLCRKARRHATPIHHRANRLS